MRRRNFTMGRHASASCVRAVSKVPLTLCKSQSHAARWTAFSSIVFMGARPDPGQSGMRMARAVHVLPRDHAVHTAASSRLRVTPHTTVVSLAWWVGHTCCDHTDCHAWHLSY